MTLETLVLRSLRHRRLATALLALAVALGVGLVVAVDGIRRDARAHFEGAAGSWDLVVGPAKGGSMQIVLNGIFMVGEPKDTLPETIWTRLRDDPRVERAVPLAAGDAYEGFRLLGTTPALFGAQAKRGAAIALDRGAVFGPFDSAHPAWEAVLGSTAAAATGLDVGASFVASHGLAESVAGSEHREAPWKVVGVLAPTGTPVDRAIYIPLEAFWAMEGHDATAGKAPGGAAPARQISTVLVKTRNPLFTRLLFGEVRANYPDALAAYPFVEVGNLLSMVGNIDRILLALAVLVVVVAALGILVAMTNAMHERRREIALMRSLGARRRSVAGLLVGEAGAVGVLGALGGLVLGHGIIAAAAARLGSWSGVRIHPLAFGPDEVLVFAGAVALCALAGLLPAWTAYRSDVAAGLAPES